MIAATIYDDLTQFSPHQVDLRTMSRMARCALRINAGGILAFIDNVRLPLAENIAEYLRLHEFRTGPRHHEPDNSPRSGPDPHRPVVARDAR